MVIVFIPARGGSKRLPRKNIRLFAGRPLIAYSIALAKAIPEIDRCIVSTEDDEIARVSLLEGAQVVKRPAELADDLASTQSVAFHLLDYLKSENVEPSAIVTLQPNCPLRTVGMVKEALSLFLSTKPDSVITVTESIHKLGQIKNGLFTPRYKPGIRAQDMSPEYYENGLVYVTAPNVISEKKSLFGSKIVPLVTEPMYAMGDIDTELDFQIAEFLYQKYRSHFEY